MKRRVKLQAAAGVQSRQMGGEFVFYEGSRPYRWRKMGNQVCILPPAKKPGFRHPWETTVRWYEKGEGLKNYQGEEIEGFGASVNPGLVNGIDPIAFGAWSNSSNLADVPSQGKYRKAPGLLDFPIVPLFPTAFRLVERGMSPKVTIPLGLRQLGAVEYCAVASLYLRAARPSVMAKGDVDMSNAFFGGVQYRSKFSLENLSQWGYRAQLMVGVPPEDPPPRRNPFDAVVDLGFDYFPIVEIFLISGQKPRKDDRGKPIIDGGWIPFVRHHCFWNLEHRFDASALGEAAQMDRLQSVNPALPFIGIIGRYTIAPIASSAAMTSLANEAIASNIRGVKGRWWT